jgi:nucleoside-triphosphatase THEP1
VETAGPLAHVRSRSRHRVGRYGVEPDQLEPLAQEEQLGAGALDVCLIDEAGKMELFACRVLRGKQGRPLVGSFSRSGLPAGGLRGGRWPP